MLIPKGGEEKREKGRRRREKKRKERKGEEEERRDHAKGEHRFQKKPYQTQGEHIQFFFTYSSDILLILLTLIQFLILYSLYSV